MDSIALYDNYWTLKMVPMVRADTSVHRATLQKGEGLIFKNVIED
jgi:hypothetical protein